MRAVQVPRLPQQAASSHFQARQALVLAQRLAAGLRQAHWGAVLRCQPISARALLHTNGRGQHLLQAQRLDNPGDGAERQELRVAALRPDQALQCLQPQYGRQQVPSAILLPPAPSRQACRLQCMQGEAQAAPAGSSIGKHLTWACCRTFAMSLST